MTLSGTGSGPGSDIRTLLGEYRRQIDAALDGWLGEVPGTPPPLLEAVRYSLSAGGKRIRPILLIGTAEGLGYGGAAALRAGCSFEVLHTYSLIHDDLPAMDNDDLRRGKPTCHKVFGEANAILAGDALLTLAFEGLASLPSLGASPQEALEAVSVLARATGMAGMVGGQVLDLAAEGQPIDLPQLRTIHRFKTGALMAAAVEVGAILGRASPEDRAGLARFGSALGLLFQIVDDILDEEGTTAELGKTTGKDRAAGKATYPALLGLDEAKRFARATADECRTLLQGLSHPLPFLQELVGFIHERRH